MTESKVLLQTEHHSTEGILLIPKNPGREGIVLAHGAGGNMNAPFIRHFHRALAEAGYPCLRFDFFYSHAGKRAPDPKPVLIACYRKALEAIPAEKLIIGGKSMGGRIASYLGTDPRVAGLLFLGYPLHPPGKPDQLRDEHLYSIHKPMFFATGTKDPFALPHLLENTILKIGGHATLFSIENGGHSFELPRKAQRTEKEVWTDVLDAILEWIDKKIKSQK